MSFFHSGVATLAAATMLVGCGYAPIVAGDSRGDAGTPVAVLTFENRTFEPSLEARFTDRLRARVAVTAPWKLVSTPEAASLVLRGTVSGFSIVTVSFDAGHRPLEQRVAVTADIVADMPDGPPFRGVVTGTAEYRETDDHLRTRAEKNRAIDEAAENAAREAVARVTSYLSLQRDAVDASSVGDP